MNDLIFFILLVAFVAMLIKKEAVSLWLFDKTGINLQASTVLYISIFLIIALMTYGILFDNTKDKYSNISDGYNSMRPNAVPQNEKNKPHRFFDIDFDSIFPWN